MKTLRTLMIGVALFTVCTAAKATFHTDEANMSKNFAINTYIDAMTRGKANGMNEVLDPSVKFTMLRGKKVISFSKKEVLENLKNDKDVAVNKKFRDFCAYTYEVRRLCKAWIYNFEF